MSVGISSEVCQFVLTLQGKFFCLHQGGWFTCGALDAVADPVVVPEGGVPDGGGGC